MRARDLLLRSGTWWLVDRLVTGFAALVTQVWLARILGVESYGHVAYITGVIALLFPIAQMGVGGLVGAALVQNEAHQRDIIAAATGWRLIGGVVAALLGMIYWSAGLQTPASSTPLLLLSAALVPLGFSFLEFRFQAIQQPQRLVPWRIGATVIGTALKIYAAYIGGVDFLVVAIAVDFTMQGIAHLLAHRVSAGEWIRPSFTSPWFTWFTQRNGLLLASGIAEAIYLRIDVAMLGLLSTPSETAIYSVAARLSELWLIIPAVLVAALAPKLFSIMSPGAQFNRNMQATFDALSALSISIVLGTLLVGGWIIEALFGGEYAAAQTILSVHIWSILFLFGRALYSRYLLSADLIRESLISTASGAAINLMLNLMLIPRLGALGAAVATVVSYGIAGWLILYTRRSTRHVAIMMSKSFMPIFRLAEYSKNIRQFFSQH